MNKLIDDLVLFEEQILLCPQITLSDWKWRIGTATEGVSVLYLCPVCQGTIKGGICLLTFSTGCIFSSAILICGLGTTMWVSDRYLEVTPLNLSLFSPHIVHFSKLFIWLLSLECEPSSTPLLSSAHSLLFKDSRVEYVFPPRLMYWKFTDCWKMLWEQGTRYDSNRVGISYF